MRQLVNSVLGKIGFELVQPSVTLHDIDPEARRIMQTVTPYTMTKNCPERTFVLIEAVRYLAHNKIQGAFVETGVWRGGSSMAMAHALAKVGARDRDLWLYDTYEGMPPPTKEDRDWRGRAAADRYGSTLKEGGSTWNYASLEDVRANMGSTGYPAERLHFIRGKVQDTIPQQAPDRIALLRLDTDWYESSKHELTHLYPRLVQGGILLLDDYGFWEGVRKAVDEYFADKRIFLSRIDRGARVAVKQ